MWRVDTWWITVCIYIYIHTLYITICWQEIIPVTCCKSKSTGWLLSCFEILWNAYPREDIIFCSLWLNCIFADILSLRNLHLLYSPEGQSNLSLLTQVCIWIFWLAFHFRSTRVQDTQWWPFISFRKMIHPCLTKASPNRTMYFFQYTHTSRGTV